MIAGARVDVAPYKRDPMDFVLWKPSKPGEPAWPSPAGIAAPGRPGWHIECSAMAWKHLGETFDIHGGGIDLVFPHHENEIAQSRCAFATTSMAQVWMHNGFLQVESEKMAKSLGNFVTIRELLDGWQDYAWPGEALRFNMLRSHYRQPIDWALANLDESHKILWEWYERVENVQPAADIPPGIVDALADDLNTPQAIAELHKLNRDNEYLRLKAALGFLGFSGERKAIARRHIVNVEPAQLRVSGGEVRVRDTGRQLDPPLDPVSIDKRVDARNEARRAKNFAEADRIRDELAAMGVVLKDSKDGTTWEVAR